MNIIKFLISKGYDLSAKHQKSIDLSEKYKRENKFGMWPLRYDLMSCCLSYTNNVKALKYILSLGLPKTHQFRITLFNGNKHYKQLVKQDPELKDPQKFFDKYYKK